MVNLCSQQYCTQPAVPNKCLPDLLSIKDGVKRTAYNVFAKSPRDLCSKYYELPNGLYVLEVQWYNDHCDENAHNIKLF